MQAAIAESNRRRAIQKTHNEHHGITPESVKREVTKSITNFQQLIAEASAAHKRAKKKEATLVSPQDREKYIAQLEQRMMKAAEKLDFETAIKLRSEWQELKSLE